MTRILHVNNAEAGYRSLLAAVLGDGEKISPRGLPTRELDNVVIVHNQPENLLLTGIGRTLSTGLAAFEALQLVGGFSDPDLLVKVAPRYKDFLDGDSFHGSYGLRTKFKTGLVAQRLLDDPSTRRANMTMWEDSLDLSMEGLHDYPCTMHANFRVCHGALDLTIVMRSNDLWLGYPYDIMQFSILQLTMADFLGVRVGAYTHIAHSLHLYERDVEKAEILLSQKPVYDNRPWCIGGIGAYLDDSRREWWRVQERARDIVYHPEKITPYNTTERWLYKVSCEKIQAV